MPGFIVPVCIVLSFTVLGFIVPVCIVFSFTVLGFIVPVCIVPGFIVPICIVLGFIVPVCIVLGYIVLVCNEPGSDVKNWQTRRKLIIFLCLQELAYFIQCKWLILGMWWVSGIALAQEHVAWTYLLVRVANHHHWLEEKMQKVQMVWSVFVLTLWFNTFTNREPVSMNTNKHKP